MRKYRVSELTGNEILAQSVYLENGQVLLEKGTNIDESYKESLLALDIQDFLFRISTSCMRNPIFIWSRIR